MLPVMGISCKASDDTWGPRRPRSPATWLFVKQLVHTNDTTREHQSPALPILCEGNHRWLYWFTTQRASDAERGSIRWCHPVHDMLWYWNMVVTWIFHSGVYFTNSVVKPTVSPRCVRHYFDTWIVGYNHPSIDVCRARYPAVTGKRFPGIPGACATRIFTYLVGGPFRSVPM